MSEQATTITETWIPESTFGSRLRHLRGAMNGGTGMSGVEFAELVGISNSQISAWEHGSRPRDFSKVVAKIAAATNVDREWLAFGSTQAIGYVGRHLHAVRWIGQAELPFPSPPDAPARALLAA
jgi:transcriptional regulator with XRE-family HTH domain